MSWHVVARVGDVPPDRLIAVEVEGIALALGWDKTNDRYFAVQRDCAHKGGDMAYGGVVGGHMVCPLHRWRFSLETGKHENTRLCQLMYPVRVTGDQIEIDPTPIPR